MSTNIDNYRPISVLPVALQKLLEHTVHHQLYSLGNEQKLLSRFQCGLSLLPLPSLISFDMVWIKVYLLALCLLTYVKRLILSITIY